MLNNLKMFVLFSYSHPIYSTLAGCFKVIQSSSSSSTMAARHCIIIVMFAFIFFFNEVRGHCLERHKSLLLNFKHSLVIDESYIQVPSRDYMFLDHEYFIHEFNFNMHNHEKSPKLANWNSSTDCCLWPGVTCSGMYVTGLDLSNEGIVGGFNDSSPLFDLTSLTSLNLAMMVQRTIIPSGIGRLVNLMHLDIFGSSFIGQIPTQVSNLTRLVSLDLSSCHYLKAENPNLGMLVGNLSNLIDLRLGSIDLSSQSREWCQALSSSTPRLQVLDLIYCRLSGSIHDSFQNLTHLSMVDISYNIFSGPIPYGVFASLENLTSLTMSHCKFNGVFPHRMLQLPSLRYLDISWNDDLEASPSITFLNSSSLETLLLAWTRFSKTVPESIGEAKMLSHLDLSYCTLSGQIPKSISQLEHLVDLDMSNNNLDGHLPSFSRSRNLTVLNLSYNHLSGFFLSNKSTLGSLALSDKQIDGHIAGQIWNMSALIYLDLSNNQISGQIPHSFGNLYNIELLDLSKNELSGNIPGQLTSLNLLSVLNLSYNQLEGMIPMGNQFQTFTESSFKENKGLCGVPLNTSCSNEGVTPNPSFQAEDKLGDGFVFISTEIGYILGLGLVIMPLLFWSTWRKKYYKCIDKVLNSMCCHHRQK